MATVEFCSKDAGDFRQRYRGVFGWFTTESDKRVLVQVTDVGENKMSFCDQDSTEYFAYSDKGARFTFIPVERRVFMYNDLPCIAMRKPARQYRRGIHHDNTEFRYITADIRTDVVFSAIESYENRKHLEELWPNQSVGTLSDQIAVYYGKVYVYDTCVADFDAINNCYKMRLPVFKQELIDILKKYNVESKVV